jgi:hypothetical protein
MAIQIELATGKVAVLPMALGMFTVWVVMVKASTPALPVVPGFPSFPGVPGTLTGAGMGHPQLQSPMALILILQYPIGVPIQQEKYGMLWPGGISNLEIEMQMVRRGGQWIGKRGQVIGNGLFWHYKRMEQLLWPNDKLWHRWNELQLEMYLEHRTIGIMGPSSSGKTNGAATDVLADYYCFPTSTTVLVCSTTKERMQDRIFGEMKKYHRLARQLHPFLPGHAIDGRLRIVTESKGENDDGRDFRNGIIGVPCLMGGDFKGISEFIGIKNERIRAVFDELQMLPPAVLLAISNLDKNRDFKMIGLGNPKETTDALGILCEPSFQIGGWDSGIDQTPTTKTWETRRPDGVCIQFVGTDSPNLDGKLGIPLITQEAIDRDIAQYGQDSLQFTMMNQGMMPRGQGSRRVLTAQLCRKNHAQEQPMWLNSTRTRVAFLDAAYGGVGGDRCIFGEVQFGAESTVLDASTMIGNLVSQTPDSKRNRQILHLVDVVVVPINVTDKTEPEEQIVNFVQSQCVTRNIPPENFYYESGMRTSLVSAFARLWSPRCNPVDCGGRPGEQMVSAQIQVPRNKYYSKMITEIWFSVRMIVEAGQFRGMTESVMREFCAREWTKVGNNLIEVEPKIKMKEKIGRSPDLADAVAIGCLGAQRLGFVIDNQVSKKFERQSNRWKNELKERSKELWKSADLTYS